MYGAWKKAERKEEFMKLRDGALVMIVALMAVITASWSAKANNGRQREVTKENGWQDLVYYAGSCSVGHHLDGGYGCGSSPPIFGLAIRDGNFLHPVDSDSDGVLRVHWEDRGFGWDRSKLYFPERCFEEICVGDTVFRFNDDDDTIGLGLIGTVNLIFGNGEIVFVKWIYKSGARISENSRPMNISGSSQLMKEVKVAKNGLAVGDTVFKKEGEDEFAGEVMRIFGNDIGATFAEVNVIQKNKKFIQNKTAPLYWNVDEITYSPFGYFWRKPDELSISYIELANVVYQYKRSFLQGLAKAVDTVSVDAKLFTANAIAPVVAMTDSRIFEERVHENYKEFLKTYNPTVSGGMGVQALVDFPFTAESRGLTLQMLMMGFNACKEFMLSDAERQSYERVQLELGRALAGTSDLKELVIVLESERGMIAGLSSNDRTSGLGLMISSLVEYLKKAGE